MMLRKDNVTVQKADSFNNGSHLCVGDFYPKNGKGTDPPGTITYVTVIIRQSKTQSEQGATSCGGSTLHQEQHLVTCGSSAQTLHGHGTTAS
jgi:hypothetical protein